MAGRQCTYCSPGRTRRTDRGQDIHRERLADSNGAPQDPGLPHLQVDVVYRSAQVRPRPSPRNLSVRPEGTARPDPARDGMRARHHASRSCSMDSAMWASSSCSSACRSSRSRSRSSRPARRLLGGGSSGAHPYGYPGAQPCPYQCPWHQGPCVCQQHAMSVTSSTLLPRASKVRRGSGNARVTLPDDLGSFPTAWPRGQRRDGPSQGRWEPAAARGNSGPYACTSSTLSSCWHRQARPPGTERSQ